MRPYAILLLPCEAICGAMWPYGASTYEALLMFQRPLKVPTRFRITSKSSGETVSYIVALLECIGFLGLYNFEEQRNTISYFLVEKASLRMDDWGT